MYNGHHRKKLRLEHYDYSTDGYYFVTICCYKKQCFFGEIFDGEMVLSEYGKIVQEEILKTVEIRKQIQLDEFVIMPNHVHVVIVVHGVVGNAGMHSLQERNTIKKELPEWQKKTKNELSNAVQGIKSSITRRIRTEYNDYQFRWQKSFFDVIIKNDEQLGKTREYIVNNPLKWKEDVENPENQEGVRELKRQVRR